MRQKMRGNLRKVIKFMKAIKRRYFYRERIVRHKLGGRELTIIRGTIGEAPDYDDAWFFYLSNNCEILFDIGANIGYTALLANLTMRPKRILLIDPNPEALAWAAKNLLLNGFADNCLFNTKIVSDTGGERLQFFTSTVSASGSIFRSNAETADIMNEFIWVDTITIDQLVTQYEMVPDLLKVDVEGAEYKVLQGARQLASLRKSRFLVELHTRKDLSMKDNGELILNWAKSVGFKAWYLKVGTELISAEAIASRGRCHLLLQPDDWKYPEFLEGVPQKAALPELNHHGK